MFASLAMTEKLTRFRFYFPYYNIASEQSIMKNILILGEKVALKQDNIL